MLTLKDVDHEDLEDLLAEIELSFGIWFDYDELSIKMTFGEFCDSIIHKIKLDHVNDCTTQQMFHKLRTSIVETIDYDFNKITPDTTLDKFLPRKNRILLTKKLEDDLGFQFSILEPPHFVTNTLIIILFASFIGLFFSWKIEIAGLALSIVGFYMSATFGKELNINTVGELVKK